MMGHSRFLGEAEDYDMGSRMAQLFSGCMFAALAVYLVFSNSTRLTIIQKASFEKRLHVCCQINTIVAAISAFLNFFQLTEVDNFLLPTGRNESYSVDVARPLEWILTCPLMQLCLVIMGGPKIPEYRRTMMPGLALIVLLFGASTLFVPEKALVFPLFAIGAIIQGVAWLFNAKQVIEASDGEESLLSGDSEFRKVTLVLIITWCPFPIWFALTPEGLGLVNDVVVIQMGWACLNIVSKFTLIFFIQRVKDNYWARVNLMREFQIKTVGKDGKQVEADNSWYIEDDDQDQVVPALPGVIVPGQPSPQQLQQQAIVVKKDSGASQDDKSTYDGSVDLEPLQSKMEQMEQNHQQMESRLMEKFEFLFQNMTTNGGMASTQDHSQMTASIHSHIDKSTESIREKLGCAMGDMGKAMEKSQNMFEVKMEMAFEAQKAERQGVQAAIRSQLQEWPELFFQRMAETCDTNTATIEKMQAHMERSTKQLEELSHSQRSVMETLGGSLTTMTDGWAQQIIQENKASAFTLQTKIGVLEEMQNRRQDELQEKMTHNLQECVDKGMDKMQAVVVQQTVASTEKLYASIETSKSMSGNDKGQLQQNLAQQMENLNKDVAKHVEAGIGVFGNSLRAQLENLQSQQLAQRMESESNMGGKWDGLVARMQQQSIKQVDQMNDMIGTMVKENMDKASIDQKGDIKRLESYMEDVARAQQDRHSDIYSLITSVLEQSCGANSKAADLSAMIQQQDRSMPFPQDVGPSFRDDGRYSTGSLPVVYTRPGTAGNERRSNGRGASIGRGDRSDHPSSRKADKHGPQGVVLNS